SPEGLSVLGIYAVNLTHWHPLALKTGHKFFNPPTYHPCKGLGCPNITLFMVTVSPVHACI
ncbi:MAG: hypothetical protein KKD98_01945, partial [Candidatus Thermoplasmatota archaeon]|nr:hypothetical protein [Candidatus Thermoplasmatota archaeon]